VNGESVLAELRRADAADIPSVTALQRSAYAGNRSILGVEPLPLLADYDSLRSSCEIWLADGAGGLEGVLILQVRSDNLLLWSVATSLSARAPPWATGCSPPRKHAMNTDTCGDADDMFVDAKRRRLYVSCGEGFLDVFDIEGGAYRRIAHLPTVTGARTSLWVPELDRLFVAARTAPEEPAAIWVFRPEAATAK